MIHTYIIYIVLNSLYIYMCVCVCVCVCVYKIRHLSLIRLVLCAQKCRALSRSSNDEMK